MVKKRPVIKLKLFFWPVTQLLQAHEKCISISKTYSTREITSSFRTRDIIMTSF